MKENEVSLIRSKMNASAESLQVKHPAPEQDQIFQRNLDIHLRDRKGFQASSMVRWLIAASVILSIGLTIIFIDTPSKQLTISKSHLSELIDSSNQLEQNLSTYNDQSLNPSQYAEYIRLRLQIEQIDQQLNQYYLNHKGEKSSELTVLWKKRVRAAESLKSIFEAETLIARI